VTAASAVPASPRATSASFDDQSSGERSSNVVADETRSPPIRWSGLTATPSTITRGVAEFIARHAMDRVVQS